MTHVIMILMYQNSLTFTLHIGAIIGYKSYFNKTDVGKINHIVHELVGKT